MPEPQNLVDPLQQLQSPNVVDFPTPGDWLEQRQRSAVGAGVAGLDEDPDEAARAIKLSQVNGKPPEVNYPNIDEEIEKHKASLAAEIIKGNPYLQRYIRENPLAAPLSQNDWAQLDSLDKKLSNFGRNLGPGILKVIQAGGKGFEEYHGTQYPGAGIYGTPSGVYGPMRPDENFLTRALYGLIAHVPEEFMRILSGDIGAYSYAVGEIGHQLGLNREDAGEVITEFLQDPGAQMTLESAGPLGAMAATAAAPLGYNLRLAKMMRVMREKMEAQGTPGIGSKTGEAIRTIDAIKPWIDNGEVPPVGTGIDKIWAERAKELQRQYEEIQKDVNGLETTANAPKHVEKFIQQRDSGKGNVGIPGWVIRDIYGDKPPMPDDNLLGWVPNIQRQLDFALRHGTDVSVPLAELMTKRAENPQLSELIKDHIRLDEDGMTPFEAKERKAPPEEKPEVLWERPTEPPTGEVLAAPPRYTLKELPKTDPGWHDVAFGPESKVLDIMDGDERAGSAIAHIEGDTLVIDRLAASGPGPQGKLGHLAIKELYTQLGEMYPEVNKVAGYRASGARTISGKGPAHALVGVRRASGLELPHDLEAPAGEMSPWGRSLIHPLADFREQTVVPRDFRASKADYSMPLRDAVMMVDPEEIGPKGSPARAVHDALAARIVDVAGDVPVHVMPREWYEAYVQRQFEGRIPSAVYSPDMNVILFHPNAIFGARGSEIIMHEGTHALTALAINKFPELNNITEGIMGEAAAWLTENDPEALEERRVQYAFKSSHEFFAQGFNAPEARDRLMKIPASKELMSLFKEDLPAKPTLWDAFKALVKSALSKILGTDVKPTIIDALFKLENRIEDFYKYAVPSGKALASEDEVPRLAMGNKKQFEKWYSAAIKEAQARKDWSAEQALRIAKEQETSDWKARFADMKDEVRGKLANRPDLMLDEALRTGKMGGQKLEFPIRLADTENKKGLPSNYFSAKGFTADQLSDRFGFKTGEELLQSLRQLESQRQLEDLTPQAHFTKMVEAEAERQMRVRYGSLEDRVKAAAEDHTTSETVMDRLAESVHALGMRTGSQPWDDAAAKIAERQDMQDKPVTNFKAKIFSKAAERNGTLSQQLLRDGKIVEGMKAMQSQFLNLFVKGLSQKLEKRFDSTKDRVKNLGKAEVKGIPQEHLVYIHQFILNAGEKIARSPAQHAEALELSGSEGANLRAYVEGINRQKNIYNQDPNAAPMHNTLNVTDALLDPPPPGTNRLGLENMTVEEFNSFADSLQSMEKYARMAGKVEYMGRTRDLNETIGGMIARLKGSVGGKPVGDGKHLLQLLGSWMFTPETWFKRIDLFNQKGVFQQLLGRPIFEGQYEGRKLEKSFAKEWDELGPYPDHHISIQNPYFRDGEGELIPLQVRHGRGILANMGNALQRKKLIMGWTDAKTEAEVPMMEHRIWTWLFTPREQGGAGLVAKDLEVAQRRGDIYGKAFDISRVKYSESGGVPGDKIDLGHVLIRPFGMVKEWYHPLVPDPLRNGKIKINPEDLVAEGGGYYRPRPSHGYKEQRTGAIYRVDLTLDPAGQKLKQIINDAVMQGPVRDVGRIIYNDKFSEMFKKYYGDYYYSALDKWLHDVAGNRPWMPSNDARIMQGLTEGGKNLNNLYIAMNILGTLPKHFFSALGQSIDEVGLKGILKYMYILARQDLPEAKRYWTYSQENSGELPSRMRVMSETISGVDASLFKKPGPGGLNWSVFKNAMETIGHYPVAHSDLLISRAMWLADVERMAKEHPEWEEGDLFDHADTAVRRTHGSTIIANRPQFLRFHPLMSAVSQYQNFTTTFLQRNYEALVMAKIMLQGGRTLPEMKGLAAETLKASPQGWGKVIKREFWSLVAIAAVEEVVRRFALGGAPPPPGESTWTYLLKSGLHPVAAMLPGPLRDLATALLSGNREPVMGGTLGGIGRDVKNLYDDGLSWDLMARNPGKFLRSANRVFGLFGGGTWDHFIGTGAEYLANVMAGIEQPKGLKDWGEGIYYGTNKPAKAHR